MFKRIRLPFLALIFVFGFFTTVHTQLIPPLRNFTPESYQGENQNWAITQDKYGVIYIANNKGLLEYNGTRWNVYPSTNSAILRSVKAVGDKIYSGSFMDFGYWIRDLKGVLNYHSLSETHKMGLLEDEQFWNILHFDDWILFQSYWRIYIYNTKTESLQYVESQDKITKSFEIKGTIYYHKRDRGIFYIKEGKEQLLTDDPVFKKNNVIQMHWQKNGLTILTDRSGFFNYSESNLSPWNASNKILNRYTVYSGVKLNDGTYVLGTISNGVLFLNENGTLLNNISQDNGLYNNTVLSVFEGQENNLWLGLDSGVSLINLRSRIKVFKDVSGAIGTVYGSTVFEGQLYLGTNQGLFVRELNTDDTFSLVPSTEGQVWNLTVLENELFCSHDSGVFIIENKRVKQLIDTQGTWMIKPMSQNLLLSGDYYGLSVLQKANKTWSIRNKIDGFNNSSKYFELFDEQTIFVNHEYKGIYKLKVDQDFTRVLETVKDTSVNKGLHSSIVRYRDKLLYANRKGVYSYNFNQDYFVKDSVLSQLINEDEYLSGKLIYEKEYDMLWAFSENHLASVVTGDLSNSAIIKKFPIKKAMRTGAVGYENISTLPTGEKLIGGYQGFLVFNPEVLDQNIDKNIQINSISYGANESDFEKVDLTKTGQFDYGLNNVNVEFGVINFDNSKNIEFQYKLEGYNKGWSKWTTDSTAEFKNLKAGQYNFQVRFRVGNKISTDIAGYNFIIHQPWYFSNLMIGIYIIFLALTVIVIQRYTQRYYKRKGEKELEKRKKEFELQELEKEKELMVLKNEQLKIDVESKNRELATSTMSIIKKNEFLNSIKRELEKIKSPGVHRVIKIIDRNLNNNDDWELFEKAFNNADKDFIKKIKSAHPELTPNDLKLCAYLRLNLPSKEIAPLLNISPRSVEVKRYRLRKKMNLKHKENLTDYILEI